jgi:phosphoribosylglycinamide formyltransferase-1
MQAAVPVLSSDCEADLKARILKCEHKIFPRAIALYCAGRLHLKGRKVVVAGIDEELFGEQSLISCPSVN